MARITICYFTTHHARGGVEEHVLSFLQRLDPDRFATILACPPDLVEAFGDDLRATPAEVFPIRLWGWGPRHWRHAWRFYRFLRQRRPDILNTHMFRATMVGAPIARLAGVPTVIATFHGREPWRRGLIKGSYVVDRLVDRFVHRMIAVCESSKRYLTRTKGLDPAKITVIHNGRDLDRYRPPAPDAVRAIRTELGIADGEPLVGVVGRLDEQKGHTYLLDALPEVLRRHPRARLVLVGEGPLRAPLEQQAARLGVLPGIVFTGFRTDVPAVMGAMDVVVLPSLYEGLPLVLIEALAMARPVVATAVDGSVDVVEDGVSGILVPPADPAALAKGLLQLLDDPALARRLGEAGRRSTLQRFTLDRQIAESAALYAAGATRV